MAQNIVKFATGKFPTYCNPDGSSTDWEFQSLGFIERKLWERIYQEGACRKKGSDWVYFFESLPLITNSGCSVSVDGHFFTSSETCAYQLLERINLTHYQKIASRFHWEDLEPRTSDAIELCLIINCIPQKIAKGFCGICDSNFANEWCYQHDYELRHLTDYDIGLLRPSEYRILVHALETGIVSRLKFEMRRLVDRITRLKRTY